MGSTNAEYIGVPVFTVTENSDAGTNVGSPLKDGNLKWSMTGPAEFAIHGTTGQITVATGAVLDYETRDSYTVMVSYRNGTASTDVVNVAIRVTDVEEAPGKADAPTVTQNVAAPGNALDAKWSAPANTGPAITGYGLRYRAQGTQTWTVRSVDGKSVEISGLQEGTAYEVQVRAVNDEGTGEWSDSGTGQTTTSNSAPAFSGSASRSIAENSDAGTAVGQPVTATDPDGDSLSYTLSGASEFVIDASTGQIRVARGADLDYETATTYTVTVSATDGEAQASVSVTINVTDVEEGAVLERVETAETPELTQAGIFSNLWWLLLLALIPMLVFLIAKMRASGVF